MSVKLCGPVLSSIFFDQSCCSSDQEGLLLGKVVSYKTNAISDSQISAIKEEISIYIYGYISCSSSHSWYNNAGKVDVEALRSILKSFSLKDVIGWYKFRRNSSLIVSLRERAVHKSLKEMLPGIPDKRFLFLLCGMQSTSNGSTHSLEHTFLVQSPSEKKFTSISSEVINLGDTSHNEYKMQPSMNINTQSGAFHSAIIEASDELSLAKQSSLSSCVPDLNKITSVVTTKLENLCKEVNLTEVELGALRKEIKEIKAKIKLKEDHLKSVYNPLPLSPVRKESSDVPKISLDRMASFEVGTSSKAKRLSSGSSVSPSSRKILNFEQQPSRFDIRRGSEVFNSDNKANSNGDNEKMETATDDLICLDDDDDDDDDDVGVADKQSVDIKNFKPLVTSSVKAQHPATHSASGGKTTSSATNPFLTSDLNDIHLEIASSQDNSQSLLQPGVANENVKIDNNLLISSKNVNINISSSVLHPQSLFTKKETTESSVAGSKRDNFVDLSKVGSDTDSSSSKTDDFSGLVNVLKDSLNKKGNTLPKSASEMKKQGQQMSTNSSGTSASSTMLGAKGKKSNHSASQKNNPFIELNVGGTIEDDILVSDDNEISDSPQF